MSIQTATARLAGPLLVLASLVNSAAANPLPAPAPAASAPTGVTTVASWRSRHAAFYKRTWGIDIVGVKPVSSGYMLAFKYRVLDPAKAKLLNERKAKAYLIDEATGTVLAVPAMENIGELRSGTTPEEERVYFMIFGNPGRLVKSGSKVSIVAGDFRIQGLIVD